LIGEVEISRRLIDSFARTRNMCAATPGCERMPAPTSETLPRSVISSISIGPIVSCAVASALRVPCTSSSGTENESSAEPWTAFWRIVSTLTCSAATASKIAAAVPGTSGTPRSVNSTSSSECVTAETIGASMPATSSIQVPFSSENVERAWMGTPWARASSTERNASTLAPDAAISSISSYDTASSLRLSGTMRGSAL
jgi:hypothetical protein